MAVDPIRPLRTAYLYQLLSIIRQARQSVVKNVRPLIISPGPLDLDELERMIELALTRHLDVRGKAVIESFVKLGYQRGIDYTVGQVQAQLPSAGPDFRIIAGVDWTRPDMQAIDELSRLSLADLKGINSDLGRKILRTIVEDDKKGLGITRISKDVTEQFNSIGLPRAEMIARTSINHAYNRAAWERIRKYAPFKMWIDTEDDRTRPGHRQMHHVIVPAEEPFEVPAFKPTPNSKKTVPGCKMQYPGDISFDPDLAQIINCRCTLGPKFTGPKKPIKKAKPKKKEE